MATVQSEQYAGVQSVVSDLLWQGGARDQKGMFIHRTGLNSTVSERKWNGGGIFVTEYRQTK